jgi:hypothetical protein
VTHPPLSPADLSAAGGLFGFEGPLIEARPHGSGHIHDTFLVRFARGPAGGAAIVQRINERVFADPGRLMENITRVTAHLAARLAGTPDAERRALSVIPTLRGAGYGRDASGAAWRAYRWIAGTRSFDALATPGQARSAALAFARFQRQVADLPPPRLHETLPDFHHTPKRFAALVAATERDPHHRATAAAPAIAFALGEERLAGALHRDWQDGLLVERITHNDTKLNNVLFDEVTGEPLCVVDLDTVMPGLPLWDFGDLARSTLLPEEDERDLGKIAASTEIFAALVAGYAAGLGDRLLPAERERLVLAAEVLTLECGLRFLTDHLLGDVYFKTHRPGQNLDRANAHFALVRSLPEREALLGTGASREHAAAARV